MNPAVLMGDPAHFQIVGGSNPFTRNWLGMRKMVCRKKAIHQWRCLAGLLTDLGVEVYVIPAEARAPGLVYPANAGVLAPDGTFLLSHLLPARAAEMPLYESFLASLGVKTARVRSRFEGEADFFPAEEKMLFTYGTVMKQRFVPRLGLPPWRRIYGFRSEWAAREELEPWFPEKEIICARLIRESFYHGDTAFCSFGENRQFLLAYLAAVEEPSREALRRVFQDRLIELSDADAAIYAANSFYAEIGRKKYLVVPQGVSCALLQAVKERGVEPLEIDVSEFLLKGGGSVKCMIGILGFLPNNVGESIRQFRAARLHR